MPKNNEEFQEYRCSITGQIMIDPVFTADGFTYEREAIENWLKTHNTSPETNLALEHRNLTNNQRMRSDILGLLSKQPELYDQGEVYLPKSWVRQCVMAIKNNQPLEVQKWLAKDRRLLTLKLEDDSTALHLACEFSSPELVDVLLKTLKQRNQSIIPGAVGFKPLHLNALLDRALTNGDQAQCELLLRLGAKVEQPEASTQNSLLHRMVIKNNQPAVRWLLDQKAVLESCNREGNTPLLLSVIQRNANLTEFLLKMKANPQVKNTQDENPFYIAVGKGDVETARLLVAAGANLSLSCGTAQLNPLHIVSERGDVEMLRYLLQTRAAALIDVQNANGDTPLHLAVRAEQESIIPLLLEAGAYHKIKNEQDRTPIKLARTQQKPKLANLIVQTVRGLKQARTEKMQAKLKETDRLHQVVTEQASKIVHLEAALQSQGQSFKTRLSDAQREQARKIEQLEAALRREANNALEKQGKGFETQLSDVQKEQTRKIAQLEAALGRESTQTVELKNALESQGRGFKTMQKTMQPALHQFQVNETKRLEEKRIVILEFLRLVAEGEQEKAEAMLRVNPALALASGDVTDLSKRTFKNITGFQYAVWALDWHMWTMIRKYLPPEEAQRQAQGFETGAWVIQHGVHANLNTLIQAYQTTLDLYNAGKYAEANTAWVRQVGGAQLLLPAHVVNEYCHPTRPFHPLPNFKEASGLPRSRVLGWECGSPSVKDWEASTLGDRSAAMRGASAFTSGVGWHGGGVSVAGTPDHKALSELSSTRTAQRQELITELKTRSAQRNVA